MNLWWILLSIFVVSLNKFECLAEKINVCEVKKSDNTTIYLVTNCIINNEDHLVVFQYRPFSIIEEVFFNNSIVEYMPKKIFTTFELIQILNISQVGMKNVKKQAFEDAKILLTLDLYGNQIKQLEDNVFEGAYNLEYLNLSNNCIEEIECLAFTNLHQLMDLDLSCNSITTLHEILLEGLSNLMDFNISHNKILMIPNGFFDKNYRLKSLDISHNNIHNFYPYFPISQLCYLSISHNYISALVFEVNKTNEVECYGEIVLKADNNRINKVIIPELYDVNIFLMHDNNIYDLDNITSIKSITELSIGSNPLNKEHILQLSSMVNLQKLSISNLNIKEFDLRIISNLTHLLEFDISNNALKELDLSVITSLHDLTRLNISHNQLMHIDEDYLRPIFPNLKLIDLNVNKWGCQYLDKMLHSSFKRQKIQAIPQKGQKKVKNQPNIAGVACLQEATTGHLQILKEEILADIQLMGNALRNTYQHENEMLENDLKSSIRQIQLRLDQLEERFITLQGRLLNLTDTNEQVMIRLIKLLDGE